MIRGDQQFIETVEVTWTRWLSCPYMVKLSKSSSSEPNNRCHWNLVYDDIRYYQVCSNDDPWLTFDPLWKGQIKFLMYLDGKKLSLLIFSETIGCSGIIIGTITEINESIYIYISNIRWERTLKVNHVIKMVLMPIWSLRFVCIYYIWFKNFRITSALRWAIKDHIFLWFLWHGLYLTLHFQLVGLAIAAVGFILRFGKTIWEPVLREGIRALKRVGEDTKLLHLDTDNLDLGQIITGLAIGLIVGGLVLCVLSFLGCCGACYKINVVLWVVSILFIIHLHNVD